MNAPKRFHLTLAGEVPWVVCDAIAGSPHSEVEMAVSKVRGALFHARAVLDASRFVVLSDELAGTRIIVSTTSILRVGVA